MPVIAIIVLVLGILLILAGLYLIKSNKDKAEKIGNAEEKARNIIDEALKAAETKKREGLLELKETRTNWRERVRNVALNCRSLRSVFLLRKKHLTERQIHLRRGRAS